jgi:hypothetical protein
VAAVSYSLAITQTTQGMGLEAVVAGALAPAAGQVEIRIDQTATTITDAQSTTGTRALKKGEAQWIINILTQYLMRDTNVVE